MATKDKAEQSPPSEPMPPLRVWLWPVVLGWLVPGGGHFLLKRNGRGGLILASVTCMFVLGVMMRGALFIPQTSGDMLSILINTGGYIGDMASGLLFFVTTWLGYSQLDIPGHVHDYGTKFLVTAGLLNILAMVDAYEIAGGRKD